MRDVWVVVESGGAGGGEWGGEGGRVQDVWGSGPGADSGGSVCLTVSGRGTDGHEY